MAKKRTKADIFQWTDDEVELLLQTILDYKTAKAQESIDWESCQSKYSDISELFLQHYPSSEPGTRTRVAYPHEKESLSKNQVASKLKNIRIKYREAVDSQKRSGHGRVISLYFEQCCEIWGGSPATTAIGTSLNV